MRVLSIIHETTADGPGLRNSIYVAGCPHHCPGCHNPESWDPLGGRELSPEELWERVRGRDLSISGGDPLSQPESLLEFLRFAKTQDNPPNIWVWTGYKIEELSETQRVCLGYIDTLIDGPYLESRNQTNTGKEILWRGSDNQRIITLS